MEGGTWGSMSGSITNGAQSNSGHMTRPGTVSVYVYVFLCVCACVSVPCP
jgi:hypothetical protein